MILDPFHQYFRKKCGTFTVQMIGIRIVRWISESRCITGMNSQKSDMCLRCDILQRHEIFFRNIWPPCGKVTITIVLPDNLACEMIALSICKKRSSGHRRLLTQSIEVIFILFGVKCFFKR